ncbi:hypothetical protein B0H13DRAFT_1649728 [Mycena leptocephala]|nr:hypothetical protein B0H13DRAFT_1649728 [Mycena leptocephala]
MHTPATQAPPSTTETPPPPPPPSTQPPPSGSKGKPRARPKAKPKVRKVAGVPELAVDVVLPEHAPRWLEDSVEWLRRRDLGFPYTSLLATLVRLEEAFGFDEETYGALPSEGRPVQVHDWIRSGRARTKKIPVITDVERYADAWQGWWDSMQPEWRSRGPDKKWKIGGDTAYGGNTEWGVLDRPGPNGCLSVVASLFFWGVCENQSVVMQERWREAVEDVSWILEGLVTSMK